MWRDDDETPDTPSGDSNVDNGHVYVDLGLPSGLKWADRNVGADKVEAYGDYFAWGETKAKSDYSWSTYAYGSDYNKLTKYCSNYSYGLNGFTDALTELELSDDAARANWGGSWRMPTDADFQELINNTTAEWVENYNGTGVKGYRFTSINGNHIFLVRLLLVALAPPELPERRVQPGLQFGRSVRRRQRPLLRAQRASRAVLRTESASSHRI